MRPDWLPEKFYKPDVHGGLPAETLGLLQPIAQSYAELEKRLSGKTDEIRAALEAERKASIPETYTLTLPDAEALGLPDGAKVEIPEDDPLFGWFKDFAKEQGLSQEAFDGAISTYMKMLVGSVPKPEEEIAKLGDNGTARRDRADAYLAKHAPRQVYEWFSDAIQTAAGVEAVEWIMQASREPAMSNEGDPSVSSALTQAELETMMKDPRYWQQRDPAFIAKVDAGFAKLYGQQAAPGTRGTGQVINRDR